MTGVVLGIVLAGERIIRKRDKPLGLGRRGYLLILAAAVLEGWSIRFLTAGEPGYSRILLSVLGGSLLLACVTDISFCQVYNFTWWPGLAAVLLLFGGRSLSGASGYWDQNEAVPALCLFLFLQTFFFRRMYGRADYYAFCICALAEAAEGLGLKGFLTHMLLAYAFLFPIQAFRRNIDRRGNLKSPVPFLPYITAAFWVMLMINKFI